MKKNKYILGTVALATAIAVFFLLPSGQQPQNTPMVVEQTASNTLAVATDVVKATEAIEATATTPKLKKTVLKPISEPLAVAEKKPLSYKKLTKEERIKEALELEKERIKDPNTGEVPWADIAAAREQTLRIQAEFARKGVYERGSVSNIRWNERGPGNVGGRTRLLWVDLGDATRKTMFLGGAIGGLWRSDDITAADPRWVRVNDWLENLSMGSMAQDTRNPNIMFLGTGDPDGNDTKGGGVFKSVDRGKNWTIVPQSIGNFEVIPSMVVTPDSSYVFAASFSGLWKSKDAGVTWTKVLGLSVAGGASDKFWRVQYMGNGLVYACTESAIFKSTLGGEVGTWTRIVQTSWSRMEMCAAPSDPNTIYCVGAEGGRGSAVKRTNNGGTNWTDMPRIPFRDGCGGNPSTTDFTRGQVWYDLTLIVAPNNPNHIWVGGIDQHRSLDGGLNWEQMTAWAGPCNNPAIAYAHADQHGVLFEPGNPNVLYLGTDGGLFRVNSPAAIGKANVEDKNLGYVTTQFYGCAIHPDSGTNHFLAGAQDNGTLLVRNAPGIGTVKGRSIGGDGFLCFIDQNQPQNIQIGSLYGGIWFLSTDNGANFSAGKNSDGGFYTPADYDDSLNILYAQSAQGDFWRWKINNDSAIGIDMRGVATNSVSVIQVDNNITGRVYVGTQNGFLYRCENAHVLNEVPTALAGRFTGRVSSVDIEYGNPLHLLVTVSSANVNSVFESTDGGATWTVVEGNLPSAMPVRWGIFNPRNAQQALIATEYGVWSTERLNGAQTQWIPPVPSRGTPLVRTEMLQVRRSDFTVLAATYGRGMWTSNVFSDPKAVADFPGVSYINANTRFVGERSAAAEKYNWAFGDGGTDTLENTQHRYSQIGTYNVALNINGNNTLRDQKTIKILPDVPTPYVIGTTNYQGNFDGTDTHFGAWSPSGSKFERGDSRIIQKGGTKSGRLAYVLALNDTFYKKNTTAYLYTPNYNMSESGIYQFSFWSVFLVQNGYDGFKVEYSLDKGNTWQVLGGREENWYNYTNTSVSEAAFPIGDSYFSRFVDDWTRFKTNISFLAGNPNVAFRFAFRSVDFIPSYGLAIDDVEISRYDGELKTAVTKKSGAFNTNGGSISITFETQPEYFAQKFYIEMSENGRDFTVVDSVNAKSGTSAEATEYVRTINGTRRDVYFFRIKSVNANPATAYSYTFTTPIFVVKRKADAPISVYRVLPTLFTDRVGITFNNAIEEEITFEVFDIMGRKVFNEALTINSAFHEIQIPNLSNGVYLLSVKIGENKPETFKIQRTQ